MYEPIFHGSLILGLHVTSSKDHLRSYASSKSDTAICSGLLCVEISCQILSRYETPNRSYGRLNTVTIEPLVTLPRGVCKTRKRNMENGIRNTEYGIRNTEYGIQNTENGIQNYGLWIRNYGNTDLFDYEPVTRGIP